MAMAMTNLLLKPPSMIIAPKHKHTQQPPPFRFERCSVYTPPTSSFKIPRLHLSLTRPAIPISPVLKERIKGFGGNINCADFWGPLSRWYDVVQTDEKLLGQLAAKEDRTVNAVAETKGKKDDKQEAKRKSHKTRRRMSGGGGGGNLSPKIYAIIVGASFCLVVAIFCIVLPKQQALRCIVVPYSDLVDSIDDGSVIHVRFVEDSKQIYYNTKSSNETPQTKSGGTQGLLKAFVPKWQYTTSHVGDDVFQLIKVLKDKKITYSSGSAPQLLSTSMKKFFKSTNDFLYVMLTSSARWIGLFVYYYQLYLYFLQNIGKMRKRKPSKKHFVTFDDVEGADAAKAELLEIVSCIKKDSKYMKLGSKLPRGVLLACPLGTGKILLARAVAGEADVAFFSIYASELVEVYVGTGAARVRGLFREARKCSPSIIFIDEIDAVGRERGSSSNSERDQTLNQLLTEMDGFEKSANVVVIAATNRPESLDSALMRPGRFSRKVVVGEQDEDGRRKIFDLYMEEVPMKEEDKDVICDLVASLTPGLVGADLENIAHESVLLAARRDGDFVTKEDVLQAVERATTRGRGGPIKKYEKLYNFFLGAALTLNKKILKKSYTSSENLKGCPSTTKICNDDSGPESKSPYLFGQMALEKGHFHGGSVGFRF